MSVDPEAHFLQLTTSRNRTFRREKVCSVRRSLKFFFSAFLKREEVQVLSRRGNAKLDCYEVFSSEAPGSLVPSFSSHLDCISPFRRSHGIGLYRMFVRSCLMLWLFRSILVFIFNQGKGGTINRISELLKAFGCIVFHWKFAQHHDSVMYLLGQLDGLRHNCESASSLELQSGSRSAEVIKRSFTDFRYHWCIHQ